MAATANNQKTKNRLDFGAALNEALFNDESLENLNSEDFNIGNNNENFNSESDNVNDSGKEDSSEVKRQNDVEVNAGNINVLSGNNGVKKEIMAEPSGDSTNKNTSVNSNIKKEYDSEKNNDGTATHDEDEDDAIFLTLAKGENGVQRSVYFESGVYHYLQSKAQKYNIKFSNVVNLLLKEAIYKK